MPLAKGSKAPDFTLPNQDNIPVSLKEQLIDSSAIILLFYPKDFTQGCTQQMCSFRDDYSFFSNRGIKIFGISHDSVHSHSSFAKSENLPFPLLSDVGRKISRMYEAVYPFGILTRRVSYLIGSNGVILDSYDALLDSKGHLEHLKKQILAREKSPQKS